MSAIAPRIGEELNAITTPGTIAANQRLVALGFLELIGMASSVQTSMLQNRRFVSITEGGGCCLSAEIVVDQFPEELQWNSAIQGSSGFTVNVPTTGECDHT